MSGGQSSRSYPLTTRAVVGPDGWNITFVKLAVHEPWLLASTTGRGYHSKSTGSWMEVYAIVAPYPIDYPKIKRMLALNGLGNRPQTKDGVSCLPAFRTDLLQDRNYR